MWIGLKPKEDIKLESRVRIGVYISESSITAGLVDPDKGKVVEESLLKQSVNTSASCPAIITSWVQAISPLLAKITNIENSQIDIAIPGPFNYARGISLMKNQNKYDSLYKLNVKELLSKEIGIDQKQFSLKNDATCFLLGEVCNGSMVGFNNVIGITLGLCLGSAHCQNNKVRDTDLWRMRFLDGNAEDYISTKWFIKRWKALTGRKVNSLTEIVEFPGQNKKVTALFGEFSENLAQFLYFFIKKKHPTAVVLGGDILDFEHLFFSKTQKCLYDKMGISIPVIKSVNRESSTIIGATLVC